MRKAVILMLVAAILALASGGSVCAAGPVKVQFWYSLAGRISETTKALVAQFNASHKDIQVEAIYQGSYDDSINKLKAAIQSKSLPHVIQIYDIGTRFMIDSEAVVPVQKYLDRDKMNVATFEPNILAYYTIGKSLYSMPFNVSTPLLYFNKDAFRKAGLDPNKPPRTFDEVKKAAAALTERDAAGKVTRPGMAIAIYGWFFEQFLAAQGDLYANNGNGRDGTPTAVAWDTKDAAKILEWWYGMVKEGTVANLGRKTADTQKAFISGQVAMTIDSTAVLGDIMAGVGGKFEVGTGYLPRPQITDPKGGVIPGGGSLWLLGSHSAEEEAAAWEFVKFMTAPKQQAFWHMNTGYFPVTRLAWNEPEIKVHSQKYPQFTVALDQLHDTPINRATQGGLLGVFTQARLTVEEAIELVLNGKASPDEALKRAAAIVDGAIARYNQTVGK